MEDVMSNDVKRLLQNNIISIALGIPVAIGGFMARASFEELKDEIKRSTALTIEHETKLDFLIPEITTIRQRNELQNDQIKALEHGQHDLAFKYSVIQSVILKAP